MHPLEPRGKKPLIKWQATATTDADVVRRMWEKWPNANVGVIVPAGHVVLDLDMYKQGSRQQLAALEAGLGPLPRTHTAHTGGGGEHPWL
ncbi:bifunctional DNA primase/polymerase, partial [Nocardia aurea]|uniref:bifunctional DNA primase/polymerase n=1 Tax=Nocardia aurea TaxID=2144174 RepID=UPI0033B29F14